MNGDLDGNTDWQGIVLVISALGTVITGIIAALANYNAGKANTQSAASVAASAVNKGELETIKAQTNGLSSAMARVAQTDADARLHAAKQAPAPVVVAPVIAPADGTPVKVEVVTTSGPVAVKETK